MIESGPHGNNLILIGFMGCGKSSVGRELARMVGYDFVDTDALIVEAAGGRPIPEQFETEGEERFRERETEILLGLGERQKLVVSTGGGLPLASKNQEALGLMGFVIWLDATADVILERVAVSGDRPLLNVKDPAGTIAKMLAERRPIYEEVSDLRVETDGLGIQDVAYGVAESARVYFED